MDLLRDSDPSGEDQGVSGWSLKASLSRAFLPRGFPASVTRDYLEFQVYDSIQALSSYIRGMATTHAILKGMGTGDGPASHALSALTQFVYRDVASMAGGLLFTSIHSGSFDSEAKQWRLFADVINDVGMTLELLSPAASGLAFTGLVCLGSICRALCGVSGGATRAALTQHFALRQNNADISAKEGSQETLTTLVGMLLGLGLTRAVSDSLTLSWALFVFLTAVHVWANAAAMKALAIDSINAPRARLLAEALLRSSLGPGSGPAARTPPTRGRGRAKLAGTISAPSPRDLSASEPLVASPLRALLGPQDGLELVIGARPSHIASLGAAAAHVLPRHALALSPDRRRLYVVLNAEAGAEDDLLAYFHAFQARLGLIEAGAAPRPGVRQSDARCLSDAWDSVLRAWPGILEALRAAGWNTARVKISASDDRGIWGPEALQLLGPVGGVGGRATKAAELRQEERSRPMASATRASKGREEGDAAGTSPRAMRERLRPASRSPGPGRSDRKPGHAGGKPETDYPESNAQGQQLRTRRTARTASNS